jgi:DNA ligase-associated metallophosphoesterase
MVHSQLHITLEQRLWLLPQRAIFWEEQKALIVADLHLGKTGHFRKAGIVVPQAVYKNDLHRLFALIQFHKPEQLIIVGDMFHSKENKELDLFKRWRNDVEQLQIHLIKGNHDILQDEYYISANINLHPASLHIDRFAFIHETDEALLNDEHYFFSGHIHPGITVKTGSRQSMHFPCFYFSKQHAVLPAFSAFTGLYMIKPKKEDYVFAVLKDAVVQL